MVYLSIRTTVLLLYITVDAISKVITDTVMKVLVIKLKGVGDYTAQA
jgi:hypothetical protein